MVILEGLAMSFWLLLVCVVGIANGPIGWDKFNNVLYAWKITGNFDRGNFTSIKNDVVLCCLP